MIRRVELTDELESYVEDYEELDGFTKMRSHRDGIMPVRVHRSAVRGSRKTFASRNAARQFFRLHGGKDKRRRKKSSCSAPGHDLG